ncbi:MAG TPA: nucleotidyl transferase AbiEii/AbiGii toxin family protein [Bacteroidales bacterium]|nr:nucleotidyl transferase AbiEii/AbiGii toxin family protein [Bacteroidales bacterium]HSA42758.1 nucleotidyl transferase AbiEii/AbiGii toxin family protein [Bacteroidales bacterium]
MLPSYPVEKTTLELIIALQGLNSLKEFYLVGGTALALQLKHRHSLDIDLFCNFNFDSGTLQEQLKQEFDIQLFHQAENTIRGSINGINVDIMAHRYPYIFPHLRIDGIETCSIPDIIAMKLNAISASGQRIKDFADIYFLLSQYTIADMLGFYRMKYQQKQINHVLKSLVYFKDVNESEWPLVMPGHSLRWQSVTKKLEKAVLEYLREEF